MFFGLGPWKKNMGLSPARVINGRRTHIIFYFLIFFYPPFGNETCQIFLSYLINSTWRGIIIVLKPAPEVISY